MYNPYNSHIPVLETLFKNREIKRVLETGSGFGSTVFFMNRCESVLSIEMQSEDWYEKVKEAVGSKVKLVKEMDPVKAVGIIKALPEKFDLAFIDGHGANRWAQANAAFDKTDLVVVHDTEAMIYQWEKVILPKGWFWADITNYETWTSVASTDTALLQQLTKDFKVECYTGSLDNKRYTNLTLNEERWQKTTYMEIDFLR